MNEHFLNIRGKILVYRDIRYTSPSERQDLHWDYLMLHQTFLNFWGNLLSIVSELNATLMGIIITVPKQLFIIYKNYFPHDSQVIFANITSLSS